MKNIKLQLFRLLEVFSRPFARTGIHRKFPFLVFWYKWFFKTLWPYKNIIEIQGSKMYVNVYDNSLSMRRTFQGYASNLVHEQVTTDLFKKVVEKGNIVLDLGANIGYFTLLAAKLVGPEGKVYSFEPEPKNFSYLKKNIEINNYYWVFPFQKAVSDRNGKTNLYICDYDTGHHTINRFDGVKDYSRGRETKEKSIEIETVALDSFLEGKTERVDIIKMDIEGAEYLALLGMDKILRNNPNIKIFVEFFPLLIEKMGNSPTEFIRKILEDYKFSIYLIPDDYSASKGEMKKLNNVSQVMSYCKDSEDHINLFLKKE